MKTIEQLEEEAFWVEQTQEDVNGNYQELRGYTFLPDELQEYKEALTQKVREEERERVASLIPSTWLDPLLTGEGAALTGKAGEWGSPDIESLLRALKAKILTPTNEP